MNESKYPPSAKLARHAHASAFFAFVMEGGYAEQAGTDHRECGVATLTYHPPGEQHSNHFAPAWSRTLSIDFSAGWLKRFHAYPVVLDSPRQLARGAAVRVASQMCREFTAGDGLSPLVMESLAVELVVESLGRAQSSRGRGPAWLARVVDFLHARLHEPATLSQLAELGGVHPARVVREFRRAHGCTPGEYRRRLQADSAKDALLHSGAPLSEIALAHGFCDQSHFCRVFKRYYGLSPARYRAMAQPH